MNSGTPPNPTPTLTPSIFQTGQYLLDLSFENFALGAAPDPHAIQVNVNVDARGISGPPPGETASGEYESVLILNVTARPTLPDGSGPNPAAKPTFIIELRYAARYNVMNVPVADLEPFLLIEAPRMLFPFARQVAADAAANGGLPPLLLTPIDFAQLYQQQRAKAAA
jgi:preprotein translocase subunit SecB